MNFEHLVVGMWVDVGGMSGTRSKQLVCYALCSAVDHKKKNDWATTKNDKDNFLLVEVTIQKLLPFILMLRRKKGFCNED